MTVPPAIRAIADQGHAAASTLASVTAGRAEVDLHRDLVRRLGFGDNITEPMADDDTIVAWFEEQGRDASEWREHELWRGDCYAAGHPDDEDCDEHGPTCCNRAHVTNTTQAADLIDAIPAANPAKARGALEDILLELVPADVRMAAIRLAERCEGWPS